MKLYGGYGVTASYILNYREMIIIFTSPPQKNSWYQFNRGWMSLLEKDKNVTLLRIMLQSFGLIATHFTNSTIMTHCFVLP